MRIAFIGQAGSGKDYAASYLAQHFAFRRVAFADQLKVEAFAALLNSDWRLIHRGHAIAWVDDRKPDPAMRAFLQAYGVAKREFVDTDYWVDYALTTLEAYEDSFGPQNWVVTDCRFPNEVEALVNAGFVLVRLTRPNYNGLTGDAAGHVSETALYGYTTPYSVENPGTDLFHERLDVLVATMLEGAGLA